MRGTRGRNLLRLLGCGLAAAVIATGCHNVAHRPGRVAGHDTLCAGFDEGDRNIFPSTPWDGSVSAWCLGINQVQVLGTHNSYKLDVTPEIATALIGFDAALAESLDYRHAPLDVQFDDQAIRQIELDVFHDPEGGRYADRVLLDALGVPDEPSATLFEPGFKVLHVQEIDFNSSCLTLVACLRQVEAWSDANPTHLPIAVLIELKDGTIPDPGLGFVQPLPIDADALDTLDAEIATVFEPGDLITPDEVRGDHDSLDEAVRAGGWPTLAGGRGRVLLAMDNGGAVRDLYRTGRPALEGRPVFTNATPGDADAAFVKVNEPRGNEAAIADLVRTGYLVRTRADTPTLEARSGDTTRLEAALTSGAQWVSTDYPVPGMSEWSDYVAALPGGDPARCNPVNTGPRCADAVLATLGL